MKKNILIVVVIVLGVSLIWSITSLPRSISPQSDKIQIITTLFPTYDFAKQIGGDRVEVVLLLPPGAEPHSFEPKPSDIARIEKSNIFVYTGEMMEPWAQDVIAGIQSDVHVVDSSAGINLINHDSNNKDHDEHEHEHEDEHEHEHEDEHEHTGADPHIWLDLGNAQIMATHIAQALEKVDPASSAYYQQNLKNYTNKLIALDKKYEELISKCRTHTIVYGGHYAFGYLATRYHLDYQAAQGFSPDSEPSATNMAKLIEQVNHDNLKHVFYSKMESPRIAETLTKETGVALLHLHSAHNLSKDDLAKKVSYLDIMKNNLQNLALGLVCQK